MNKKRAAKEELHRYFINLVAEMRSRETLQTSQTPAKASDHRLAAPSKVPVVLTKKAKKPPSMYEELAAPPAGESFALQTMRRQKDATLLQTVS